MTARVAVLGMAAAALCLTGCGSEARPRLIKVGLVDTGRVVQEMPEFRDLNLDWVKDNGSLYDSLPKDPKQLTKERVADLRETLVAKNESWEQRSNEFVRSAYQRIRDASGQVARERGLEMVVVDTAYTRAVYYSPGENITTDVLLKMKE